MRMETIKVYLSKDKKVVMELINLVMEPPMKGFI